MVKTSREKYETTTTAIKGAATTYEIRLNNNFLVIS